MKLLVDAALSPMVAEALQRAGFDAVHVREYGLQTASDDVIFNLALTEERTLITADTDFGLILAMRGSNSPSVIILRKGTDRYPHRQIEILTANLPNLAEPISEGNIIIIERDRVRLRKLPIRRNE